MATNKTTFPLNNGNDIPAIGLGTWQSSPNEVYDAVKEALSVGYRHIDTAAAYGNEEAIGKAIRDSGIPRQHIFVTTKLWSTDHRDPKKALHESLKRLGLDYVDLYLIHWPVALNPNGNDPKFPTREDGSRDVDDVSFIDTWAKVQELDPKKVKSIGVSNFSVVNLQKLLAAGSTKVVPAVNQVELHPYLPQPKLLDYCKENKIVLEAYSPLGSTNSPILKDPTIVELANKYNTSKNLDAQVGPANILISWSVWRGVAVLPKSVTSSRIDSNFIVVPLTDADGKIIDDIAAKNGGPKRIVDPKWGVKVFHDDE